MNNSRLPFTIAQSFRAIGSDAPLAIPAHHVINDREVCIVCAALVIFAATCFGAMLGFIL